MVIVVGAIFYKNSKCYPQASLDKYLYKILKMLYYDRIDVSEGIDVNKTSASKECETMCNFILIKYFTFVNNHY